MCSHVELRSLYAPRRGFAKGLDRRYISAMTLWNRIERAVEHGLDASRGALDKARIGVKDLSELGVLKFDVMQLERQSMKVLSQLGHEVYDAFNARGQHTVSKNTVGVKELVAELADIERRIAEKEQTMARLRSKEAAASDDSGAP